MKFSSIIALGIAAAFQLLTSCEKEKDSPTSLSGKKILAIVRVNSQDSTAFNYNTEGLVSEVHAYSKNFDGLYEPTGSRCSFRYDAGKLAVVERISYVSGREYMNIDSVFHGPDGQLIMMIESSYRDSSFFNKDTVTFSVDQDNRISKINYSASRFDELFYTDGNITNIRETSSGTVIEKTFVLDDRINPFRGNPYYFPEEEYMNNNNILEFTNSSTGSSYYEYLYDGDGYPVSITYHWGGREYVRRIYYR